MTGILLAFVLLAAGASPKFDAGVAAYRAGRYEEAQRLLEASEKEREDAAELPFYLGVCLARSGAWEKAESRLAPYAASHPAEARAWYWLGRAQLYGKRFAEARASLERAVKLEPKSADGFRTLGEIQLELKDFDGAYRAWTTANQLDPKDARTTYYLGRLFLEADFLNEAAAWFRDTLRLAPDHFAAMNYLGICAERLNMQDTAIQLYRASIAESKRQGQPFPWAYVNLAKLLRQLGKNEEAFALLEEAEKLCPEGHVLTVLGQMLSAQKQTERAEAVLRRAVELDPTIPDAHYALALALRGAGRTDEAQAEMARFQEAKQAEERNKTRILATRKAQ
jgi:tetratricopeptide (TPR) repeat protein